MPRFRDLAAAAAAVLLAYAAGDHWRPAAPRAHAVGAMPMPMDHHRPGATRVAAPAPAPNQVVIDDFAFGPATIAVAPGTTVTWVNADDEPHTVTGTNAAQPFKSAPLDTGDKFSVTFKAPGAYPYFCTLHPRMQGVVEVR